MKPLLLILATTCCFLFTSLKTNTKGENKRTNDHSSSSSTKAVRSYFESTLKFSKRGNVITVVVPFEFDWKKQGDTSVNEINNLRKFKAVTILPVGGSWGEFEQEAMWYLNAGEFNTKGKFFNIEAYGTASEKRILLVSTQGKTKLTGAMSPSFKVGKELEPGFIIRSASVTQSRYSILAKGRVYIDTNTSNASGIPTTQFKGTIKAIQSGILKN